MQLFSFGTTEHGRIHSHNACTSMLQILWNHFEKYLWNYFHIRNQDEDRRQALKYKGEGEIRVRVKYGQGEFRIAMKWVLGSKEGEDEIGVRVKLEWGTP